MATVTALQFRSGNRLPIVLQTEKAECALACLAMVARFHGMNVDLEQLRGRFAVSLKGSTLGNVMSVATALGFESRAIRLELEHLDRLRAPCILHWNFNHFVVLKKVTRNEVVIHDPGSGLRKLTRAEVSAAFTGVALELWPSPKFEKSEAPAPRVRMRDLIGKVTGVRRAIGQILLVAISLEVFAILNPLVFQLVFDHVIVSGGVELLLMGALGFGLATIVQHLIRWLRAWMLMRFGTELSLQWRSNVFSHLLRLPVSYFERRQLGDLSARFGSVDRIQQSVTTSFLEGMLDGVMAVLTLVILFVYSPLLAFIIVGSIVLVGLAMLAWYGARYEASRKMLIFGAEQHTHFLESLRGIRSIKLFQRESMRSMSWSKSLTKEINAGLAVNRMDVLFHFQRGIILGLQTIAVLAVGARAVIAGEMTAGMLLTFFVYKNMFEARVIEFIDKLVQLRMLRVEGERLWDIVGAKAERATDVVEIADEKPAESGIEVRSLRFRYGEHEPFVLDDVSFSIGAGEFVAITGPSGCGKSTLVSLLLGIHPPSEGEIVVAGTNTRLDGFASTRRITGTVMQDDSLYAGSIAENICFFAPNPDQEWIEQCARVAAIHDEILAMPMKYHSLIGDMGTVLSGGQKQRVLLARALYKRPSILILDEATSHLDVDRERAVNAALRQLRLTRVVIAHRPETIAAADRYIELGGGRVMRDSGPLRVASVG